MKSKTASILLFNALLTAAMAQQKAPPSFPQSFMGHWKGDLAWSEAGKPEQSIMMQLKIFPTDTKDVYTYEIIYGSDEIAASDSAERRQYILKPVDKEKGHWAVDEKNGIVLDEYWLGQREVCVFSVKGSTVVTTYQLIDGQLRVEFITYASTPVHATGDREPNIPPVQSYHVKSIQSGVLSRVK